MCDPQYPLGASCPVTSTGAHANTKHIQQILRSIGRAIMLSRLFCRAVFAVLYNQFTRRPLGSFYTGFLFCFVLFVFLASSLAPLYEAEGLCCPVSTWYITVLSFLPPEVIGDYLSVQSPPLLFKEGEPLLATTLGHLVPAGLGTSPPTEAQPGSPGRQRGHKVKRQGIHCDSQCSFSSVHPSIHM